MAELSLAGAYQTVASDLRLDGGFGRSLRFSYCLQLASHDLSTLVLFLKH